MRALIPSRYSEVSRAQSASYQQLAGPGGVQLPDLYTVIVSFLPTDGNAIVFAVWKFQHIKNVIKDKTKRKKGDKKYVQSNLQRNLPGLRSGDD